MPWSTRTDAYGHLPQSEFTTEVVSRPQRKVNALELVPSTVCGLDIMEAGTGAEQRKRTTRRTWRRTRTLAARVHGNAVFPGGGRP